MTEALYQILQCQSDQAALQCGWTFLGKNPLIVAWCAAILAYFLVCLAALLRGVVPVQRALRRVERPLRDWNQQRFAKEYEGYSQKVRAERLLSHAWSEFDESLIKPAPGAAGSIRNTREPAAFFHDAAIVQPTVHNRFFDTVPSHLVGLGILGTFVGLAAGVGGASVDIKSEDFNKLRDALESLLRGASLAFITSIFGLGTSLLFLLSERLLVGSVHRALDAWVARLEACVKLQTPEQIALEQAEQARQQSQALADLKALAQEDLEQSKRQTRQLERFNDDLVFALEKTLEEKVGNRLTPVLEQLVRAVEAMRSDRSDSNVAAIQRLVEEFTRNLTQSTGREMEQIAATLRGLGERFQTLITAAEESQQRSRGMIDTAAQNVLDALVSGTAAVTGTLQTAVDDVAAKLRTASGDLSAQVEGAGARLQATGQATAERIAASLGAFAESVARLERVSTAQGELAERVQQLSLGLRGAGEALLEAHRGFTASLEPTRTVVRNLDAAGTRLSEALESTGRLVDEASIVGKSIQAEHAKIAAAWQDYEQRFGRIDQALQQAFRQIEEGLGRYTDAIRTFHVEADKHLGDAVEKLGGAIGELREVADDLVERLPSAGR